MLVLRLRDAALEFCVNYKNIYHSNFSQGRNIYIHGETFDVYILEITHITNEHVRPEWNVIHMIEIEEMCRFQRSLSVKQRYHHETNRFKDIP